MGGHFLTKERENKMGLWDDINEIDWWYTGNHTTAFMQSIDASNTWAKRYLIEPNPRLNDEEKSYMLTYADILAEEASNHVMTTLASNADGVIMYWDLLQNKLAEIDQRSSAVAGYGAETARAHKEGPDTSIKMPWWVYIIGAKLIYKMFKK
tara:strand:+ start:1703 stop:2158 length:456 start_codon:yes stop_codon:yes gene_type:complete